MILSLMVWSAVSFLPVAGPIDALASAAQLQMQLEEIQKLLNQNIDLSKQNRTDLANLVDELISGADMAIISLENSRGAHANLLNLEQNGLPEGSGTSYQGEFKKRVGESNKADSESAALLQQKISEAQKSSQFAAIDAQASVQTWQSLNRISMQLAELTELMRSKQASARDINLKEMREVLR